MLSRTATVILAAATTIAAQSVVVIIEASHGGAGNGLTNNSITVPLSTYYTDPKLDAVSTLYLTQASDVELDAVTCTPYRNANGSGSAGLPFNSTRPSFISTNTEQIGSVFCISSAGNSTSSGVPSQAPTFPNSTTTAHTSVLLTTVSGSVAKVSPTTFTSVETFSGANGPTTSTYTSVVNVPQATSTSAGLNSEAAAPTRHVANWLAVAGFGLVAAL